MIQSIIVILIVAGAVFYLTKKIIASFQSKGCKTQCGACSVAAELAKAKK